MRTLAVKWFAAAVCAAGFAALAPACGGSDPTGATLGGPTENTPEQCKDGQDNDGDGLVDCADPNCAPLQVCGATTTTTSTPAGPPNTELTTTACQDGRDNDNDGKVDCEDDDCKALVVCNPDTPPPSTCGACNDNLACTTDSCPATGGCTHTVNAGSCLIDNKCYANGEKNGTQCQVCDSTKAANAWTPIVGGCTIGGLCYRAGERDTYGCNICDPKRSATTWSTILEPTCNVGGRCYLAGEKDATGCDQCIPSASTTSLQDAAYTCQIGGQCYQQGAKHPSATCGSVSCNNAISTSVWTVAGDECLIGGVCYAAGAKSPDGCSACVPSQSKVAWTPQASACQIGGACYQAGAKHPNASCTSVTCDPTKSTSTWTVAGDECLIGNICRQPGDKTSNGCQICQPTSTKTNWSTVTGGCNIGGICYANGAPHPSAACTTVSCNAAVSTSTWTVGNQCLINGICYAPGAKSSDNCSECNPTSSKTTWTASATSCVISNACYANGASHPSATCNGYGVTCNSAMSTSTWSVGGDACLIGNVCYANGAFDPTGCSKCDTSVSKTSWTPQMTCSNILMAALNNGYNGNLGGITGANTLCQNQAVAAGYSGTWKAFLSSSTQNVKDLIPVAQQTLPVVNLKGQNMYASWNTMFTQSGWNTTATYLWAFNGAFVDEGQASPDWYDADGWHGSTSAGIATTYTCSDWTSSTGSGSNGEWDFRDLLGSETSSCSSVLAVACVRMPD
jgi:hypothetical protein